LVNMMAQKQQHTDLSKQFELFKQRTGRSARALVHVGKCGGTTVRSAIQHTPHKNTIFEFHVVQPIYCKDMKYIIVLRGPLSRTISAFNWRQRRVMQDGKEPDPGEYEVLKRYHCINSLAELLFDDSGAPDNEAHRALRRVGHISKDISFYLSDLLKECSPDQIETVLMQESLDEDILEAFGYRNTRRVLDNSASKNSSNLSHLGRKNLLRFLEPEFEILMKLYCWGKITKPKLMKAV
jgi:hypothetical protein